MLKKISRSRFYIPIMGLIAFWTGGTALGQQNFPSGQPYGQPPPGQYPQQGQQPGTGYGAPGQQQGYGQYPAQGGYPTYPGNAPPQPAGGIPGVDLSGLNSQQVGDIQARLQSESCTCGCGYTMLQCRIQDPNCQVSLGRAQQLVSMIRGGAAPGAYPQPGYAPQYSPGRPPVANPYQ